MNTIMDYTLSPEQQSVIDRLNQGNNIFLTGQGGTGKSFLIKYIIQHATYNGKTVQPTAMTGTASLLLNCKAKTIHSWSGIRIARGTKNEIIKNAYNNAKIKKNWKSVDILIIDEVSMMSQKIFEILEELGRIIRPYTPKPFGGIQVIFCGDFFQLPPVGSRDEPETEKFCFQSPIWNTVFKPENHIELTNIFRQKDPIYKSILSKIRYGIIDDESNEILKQRLNQTPPPDIQMTKIFPTLKLVEIENQKQFNKINEEIYEYEYFVNTKNTLFIESGLPIPKQTLQECNNVTIKNPEIAQFEIKSLLANSKCIQTLQLKVGAFVMATVNLNLEIGICNGSQGVIVGMNEKNGIPIPIVKFYNGVVIEIDYYVWQSEQFPTITIEQIPLVLAWAMSIHKSQGATLKYAQMDIGKSIFAEGQVYVALSRVESLEGLYLTAYRPDKITVNSTVKEFYQSFLPSLNTIVSPSSP